MTDRHGLTLGAALGFLQLLRLAPELHRKQACLRMFARSGLTLGLWTAHPTAALASIPKPKRVPRPFSDDEINALMALDLVPREKVVRALIYTDLRVSPLCSTKLGDISYAPRPRSACS